MHGLDPAIVPHLQTIAHASSETLTLVFLNNMGATLGIHHMPPGGLATLDVPLRTVVALALAHDSRFVVMAHNHPSGDPEPSPEDLRTTRRVAGALDLLGIRLVDHLVLAADASVSFRARGLL
jgi:DNA repair protein RadC